MLAGGSPFRVPMQGGPSPSPTLPRPPHPTGRAPTHQNLLLALMESGAHTFMRYTVGVGSDSVGMCRPTTWYWWNLKIPCDGDVRERVCAWGVGRGGGGARVGACKPGRPAIARGGHALLLPADAG